MKRREFFKSSIALSSLAGLSTAPLGALAAEDSGKKQEYYELRVYRVKETSGVGAVIDFLGSAALPALNRLGVKPVGVFTEKDPKEAQDAKAVYLLIPHPTLEAFVATTARLNADKEYQQAGMAYLQRPKTNPAFDRIDSWLLLAFAGLPRMDLPAYCRDQKPRLFELRTYESYSEVKALKKVEMFNSGEIDVMKEVGLGPIFYGQALIGPNLPHLTYMTSGENEQAHKEHWDAFGKHPIWNKLKNDPQYADTVSKISKRILLPAECSRI